MRKSYAVGLTIIAILLVAGSAYAGYQFKINLDSKKAQIEDLRNELSSTSDSLEESRQENSFLLDRLQSEEARNNDLEDRLEDAEDVLGIIVKRQTTDPELLQKYSKVFFLNEHYRPENLKKIDNEWLVPGKKDQYIHGKIWPFLEEMLEDAEDDNIDLRIISAFRSFDEQATLKGQYTTLYGSGANQFSADQGYSEHQLGTTVDLSTAELGDAFSSIDTTEAFEWLEKNAYKYGFTLSYPQGNSYYEYEPWHWRFVGKDLARYLHNKDKNFYDLDQREIDEYLVEFFD